MALMKALSKELGARQHPRQRHQHRPDQERPERAPLGEPRAARARSTSGTPQTAKRAGMPLGRVGEAEEVGDLIAFLCSTRGAYISGVSINMDGGSSGVV